MIGLSLSVERYFRATVCLVYLVPMVMAWISEVFSLESKIILPALISSGLYLFLVNKSGYLHISHRLLCWGGVIWFFSQVVLTRDVVLIGDTLAFLMTLNLLGVHISSRYSIVVGSGLLLCFSCLFLDPGVAAYLLFILFLLCACFSLNAANMYLKSESHKDRKLKLPRDYFVFIGRSLPVGLLIALAVFALFPRINRVAVQMPFSVKQRFKSGYSGDINLGEQGNIARDESIVLHVTSDEKEWLKRNALDLYLRGASLESFDGTRWQRSLRRKQSYYLYQPFFDNKSSDRQKGMKMDILTSPLNTNVIFLPDGRFSLTKISKSVGLMTFDTFGGGLYRDIENPIRYHYQVQLYPKKQPKDLKLYELSRLIQKSNQFYEEGKAYSLNISEIEKLVLVPHHLKEASFFKKWVGGFDTNRDSNLSQVFKAIRHHFVKNYRATLINQFSSESSFQDFIETDRFGHCEFFATATVMFFRYHGIPSRIAMGYRGGEFNEIADAVIVRELHAHAWVEYFIPGEGWYPFDPTPPVSGGFDRARLHFFSKYLNAANFWLNRYLVDYDLLTQRKILGEIGKALPISGGKGNVSRDQFLFIFLAFLFVAGIWFRRRFWQDMKSQRKHPFYVRRFLLHIDKTGSKLMKSPHETYRMFCHRLYQEEVVNKSLIDDFLWIVERDLYGPGERQVEVKLKIKYFIDALKSVESR